MKSTLKLFAAIVIATVTAGAAYQGYQENQKLHYTYISCDDWNHRNSNTCDERWKIFPDDSQIRQYKDIRTNKWVDSETRR